MEDGQKKSKLAVEVRVEMDYLAIEGGFSNPNGGRYVVVCDVLGGVSFDGDGNECKVQIFDELGDKGKNL